MTQRTLLEAGRLWLGEFIRGDDDEKLKLVQASKSNFTWPADSATLAA